MLTDAIEMDLPIKADAFAWDFFPLHEYATDKRFLSYVFAERWYQVNPIFDAFLRAKIFPKGALVPLAAEFSSALAARSGNFLQLCIDETATSLIFTGGERPYVRCLPYGWDRVLQDRDDEVQWDNWIKNKCPECESFAAKAGNFFHELAKEIHTCELYYFHRLQGRPHRQMTIVSSRAGVEFWIRSLKKYLTHEPDIIHTSEGWAYPTFSHGEALDEITRMHLFRGAEMIFNGSMDNPSAVVPRVVAQKRRQFGYFIAKIITCAVACGGLLLGSLHHAVQNHVLRQNLTSMRQKTEEERTTAAAIGRLNGEIERYRICLERANKIYACQAAWVALFQGLQDVLVTKGNGWLDELRLMPVGTGGPREITVSGHILAGEAEEILPKFRQFLEQLQKLPVVGSVGNLVLADGDRGVQQPFQCTITLNAKYFQP
jgi:hypothetical protein